MASDNGSSINQEIFKKSTSLTSWQIVSRVLNVFYFSLVAKFLKPFEYGVLGICMSIFDTLSTFFICTNNALIKYVAEKRERSVFERGLKINALVGLFLLVASIFFSDVITSFFALPLTYLVRLIGALLFLSAIKETFSSIFLGLTELRHYIILEASFAVLRLILVGIFIYYMGSLFGVLFGIIAAVLLTIFIAWLLLRHVSFTSTLVPYRTILRYSFTFLGLTVLYQFYPQIFILMLAKFFSPDVVGFYKFLYGLTSILVIAIPQTFSFVLFPYLSRLSAEGNHKDVESVYNMGLKFTFFAVVLISFFIFFVAPYLVHFIFPEYAQALSLLLWFLLFGIVTSLAFITGALIKATNNLDIQLKVTPVGILLSTVLAYFLIPSLDVGGAILSFTIGSLVNFILMNSFVLRRLHLTLHLLPTKQDFTDFMAIFKRSS